MHDKHALGNILYSSLNCANTIERNFIAMTAFLIFALSGCQTTVNRVQLICDGTQTWRYTDCKNTECTEYEIKQCIGS